MVAQGALKKQTAAADAQAGKPVPQRPRNPQPLTASA